MVTTNTFQRPIGGKTLTIGTGKLATQAHGSVTVVYGDTVVLVTACVSSQPRPGIDFFPLTIEFEERHYAAGKIPGSFFRREGRPGHDAVLTCRLIDRPLRPLFPKGLQNDVQVIATVLSTDQENEPAVPALVGASAALCISEIPFGGPVGATRVGYIDGELVLNPTYTQLCQSTLDVVVVGTKDAVVMVEAGAKEVPEKLVLEAVKFGQEANRELVALQEEMVQALGKPKMKLPEDLASDPELEMAVEDIVGNRLREMLQEVRKEDREAALGQLERDAADRLGDRYPGEAVASAVKAKVKEMVRANILDRGIRPDGRGLNDLREISCEVGILPRTHGSGMFTRGQTQVLSVTTLASSGAAQKIDNIGQVTKKRFMHHYNFPPYSVGETGRVGSPGRREIGHGALAEKAISPVIPSEDDFPYAIRLVSEALSSNGSTSMASVCGSSLSLMDAGVPISAPVAGVAMGLITGDDGRYAVLTDIAGLEDFMGDMDFKVAGTAKGMTAWQMDLKIKGLSFEIMEEALEQAFQARMKILDIMSQTINQARPDLSPYAPRVTKLVIDKEKIGLVIGPGGKTIRSIIEETGTTIDIEDDGTVLIGSTDRDAAKKAEEIILGLTKEVEVGAMYTGKVVRIMSFGAFVEILPGKDGMVHISELADHRVESIEDEVKVGDEIKVMVTEIDSLGRINLSRRAVTESVSGVGTDGGEHRSPSGDSRPPRTGFQPQRREGRPPDRRPFRGDRDRGPRNSGPRERRR
ncbi:MAG: polyribonucleotide nucleotidyltransferase [Dehalococcoidia bacterium]